MKVLLHSHIHEYGHVPKRVKWTSNVGNIYIHNVEHRNVEIRKHVMTSLFRYENFLLLLIKGFDIRRETQSFYSGFFIWPLSRAAPMARKFVSPQRALKVEPPRSASSFNSLTFFEIPKILRALPVRDVTHTLSPVSSSQAVVTSPSDMSALCTRTRYHLHQGCT